MAKVNLNKTSKIIISVVAVILVLVIAGGVYCITTSQNPVEAVQSVFSSKEEKLVGKWDSQTNPGLNAYVFNDDGTYDSYLSTVNFAGTYTVEGSKLTLINPDSGRQVQYKFNVTATELTLTLLDDDGSEAEVNGEPDVSVYDKVDELNMKSLTDLIGELATEGDDSEDETEAETEAETEDETEAETVAETVAETEAETVAETEAVTDTTEAVSE